MAEGSFDGAVEACGQELGSWVYCTFYVKYASGDTREARKVVYRGRRACGGEIVNSATSVILSEFKTIILSSTCRPEFEENGDGNLE